MNDIFVFDFVIKTNNQDVNDSAILKIKILQSTKSYTSISSCERKGEKIEVHRMRYGYNIGILTSVDIQEIVRIGGKLIEIFEGVIYKKIFKISPFEKRWRKIVAFRQKYENDGNDMMQGLVKIIINSLYGAQIRKDINDF